MADDLTAEDAPRHSRSSLSVVIILFVLVSLLLLGFFMNPDTSDRYRWVCEVKGHLWVQPTHGDPYCGDGTGNPPDWRPNVWRSTATPSAFTRSLRFCDAASQTRTEAPTQPQPA